MLLFLYVISPAYLLNIARRYRETTQMRTTAFGPAGIIIDDGAGLITVPWSDVLGVQVSGGMLIVKGVMPKPSSSGRWNLRAREALLIPMSAFLSPSAAEEALAALNTYRCGEIVHVDHVGTTWPPAPTDVG